MEFGYGSTTLRVMGANKPPPSSIHKYQIAHKPCQSFASLLQKVRVGIFGTKRLGRQGRDDPIGKALAQHGVKWIKVAVSSVHSLVQALYSEDTGQRCMEIR